MLWRLVFPFVLMFAPRLIPRLVRTAYLVWKLSFDSRVSLLLRLLVPATIIYFVTPIARIPLVGPVGYLLVLSAAVWLLLNLAPQDVVATYAPWRAGTRPDGGPDRDPSKVVEGSYRVADDDKPDK